MFVVMTGLTNWMKGLFDRDRTDEDLPEEEFEQEDEENPYEPGPEQASILARVKRDAEADAIRHAEDMLEQEFPIVPQAEGVAESRLAALRSAYAEKRGVLVVRIGALETAETETSGRLETTDKALVAEGVPESQVDLPPLRGKPAIAERIAVLLGAIVAMAAAVELLDLQGQMVLPLLGAAVLIIGITLLLQPGPLLEDPAVAALREQRQALAENLATLREKLKSNGDALVELERQTYAMAEREVKFAGELVTSYRSTVFSSLPVGVLSEGRGLKEQKRPSVRVPSWAMGLRGAQ